MKIYSFTVGSHVVDRRGPIRTGKIVDVDKLNVYIEWHYGLIETLRKGIVLAATDIF